EARTALAARQQRIAVTPVAGVGELGETGFARGKVGSRCRRRRAAADAGADRKAGDTPPARLVPRDRDATGLAARHQHAELVDEARDRALVTFDVDQDASSRVPDASAEPVAHREAIHGGAKS